MSTEEVTKCDNEPCNGGKYIGKCEGGHDICSLCTVDLVDLCSEKELKKIIEDYYGSDYRIDKFCPICGKRVE
jgi:hypothetical protein